MTSLSWPRAAASGVVIVAVAVAVVVGSNDDGKSPATSEPSGVTARTTDDTVDVACSDAGTATTDIRRRRDLVLGPLVLVRGKQWADSRPDAFRGHGFKVPATLPNGVVATLSVPTSMRGRVGLVFSQATQDHVMTTGVRGADTTVRFTACPAGERAGRSGWPGGLVIDRPRCATLVVTMASGESVRGRIPLGHPC
jgi:hypothetical protein